MPCPNVASNTNQFKEMGFDPPTNYYACHICFFVKLYDAYVNSSMSLTTQSSHESKVQYTIVITMKGYDDYKRKRQKVGGKIFNPCKTWPLQNVPARTLGRRLNTYATKESTLRDNLGAPPDLS